MVLEFFKSQPSSSLDEVEIKLVEMLRHGRRVFDAANAAVFGGGKSKATKREVRGTDQEINELQAEVRRILLVHAATTPAFDLTLVLSYMSVVKDAERVGDYAKNLYDLAKYGADFGAAVDRDELLRYRDNVGKLIDDVATVFSNRDGDAAQHLIDKADGFLKKYDALVKRAYKSDGPASDAVARALYFRYLKRITAHCMNILTSFVAPIDRLDRYDEADEDRDQDV